MTLKDDLVLFQQLPPKAIVTQQTSPLNIESHIVTRTHTDIHSPTITALPRSAQELSEVKKRTITGNVDVGLALFEYFP